MDKEQTPPVPPPAGPGAGIDDPRAELVRQVLASRTFAKSARLSQFLEFICRKTLEGQADQINEQQIGVHVFGRSAAYNATDDSIVRTQARLLRQRLEEYFEHECRACAMVVLIPKGGYVPVFEQRPAVRGAVAEPMPAPQAASAFNESKTSPSLPTVAASRSDATARAATPQSEQETPQVRPQIQPLKPFHSAEQRPAAESAGGTKFWRQAKGNRWFLVAAALAAVLLAVAWQLHTRSMPSGDPLWGSVFGSRRGVVIVPSDDGLVLSEELRRAPVTLDEYLSGTYLREEAPEATGGVGSLTATRANTATEAGRVTAAWLASHQYTSTADLGLAMRLNRLPEATATVVETKYARVLRLDELKSRNVILIGGIGANPWVGLFSPQLNFDVNYDWKNEQGYVINKNPQSGEKSIYREQKGSDGASSYGVLAYLPGISGNGCALLFEGSGMAGTEAASDFPFSGEAFTAFLAKLGRGPDGAIPYFEVLLETRSLGGDAPGPQVVAWRVVRR